MRLPRHPYDDWLAEITFTRRWWEREYRRREEERTAPGPVTTYVPEGGGVYRKIDENGRTVDRVEMSFNV